MKKIYLLVLVLTLTFPSYGQTAIITRVIDGISNTDCTGGLGNGRPKMVEIYVDGTIDFGAVNDNGTPMDDTDDIKYSLDVQTNGDVTGTWNVKTIATIGVVTDDFFYLMNDAGGSGEAVFDLMYPAGVGKARKALSMFLNGNDPVRITDNMGVVLDTFGDGSDVSVGTDYDNPWNYEDRVAKRNDGSTPNGMTFSESNWTFQAAAWASDGSVTCANMATDIAFGSYLASLSVREDEIENFVLFPNPVVNGKFRINTSATGITQKSIQIYSMLGKLVYNNNEVINNQIINIPNLTSGIYIIKVEEEGKLATRKLIIE